MDTTLDPGTRDLIPTRYSLLSRLQNWDDQESWKDFFDTYWRLIYSVAIKSGLNETEAQDVVQETVISVAKHIHKFQRDRARGSFKGWLRNIIRWRIADQLEKRDPASRPAGLNSRDESAGPDLREYPDPAGDRLAALWDEEWRDNLFEAALQRVKLRVKEEQYLIFDLYAVKGWSVLKVAGKMRVSVAQVYVTKHRVAALIRKEIRVLEQTPSWDSPPRDNNALRPPS
jgi:RNA polymerase sigma-70 factor (ECF subfamily)